MRNNSWLLTYGNSDKIYFMKIPSNLGESPVFSKISRPALGLKQPPIQWVPAFFPGGKAAGA
jgi:hypothetical protein